VEKPEQHNLILEAALRALREEGRRAQADGRAEGERRILAELEKQSSRDHTPSV
jgi:hypothetical protein